MSNLLDKKLDEMLDEIAYMSAKVVDIGKEEFEREGKGLLYAEFPTVADISQDAPFTMKYLPYKLAKHIEFDECAPLMDTYDPQDQVVVVVACVMSQAKANKVFKGRVISSRSNEDIPDIVDANGSLLKGRIMEVPSDPELEKSFHTPHCNNCGALEGGARNLTLLKCGNCMAVRYCNSLCQGIDWKAHKKVCKFAKALHKDGLKIIKASGRGKSAK